MDLFTIKLIVWTDGENKIIMKTKTTLGRQETI